MVHRQSMLALLAIGLVSACAGGTARGLAEPVEVEFDAPLNLIVLETRIRDQGPFRFVLDSGASGTVIDTELASRLGLQTTAATTRRSTAAGSQVTTASVRGGVDFVLAPDFAVHVERVITAPVTEAGQFMIGERFDGILGSALFHDFVIEVEYSKRTLAFHDPDRYQYNGDGTVLAIDFPPTMSRLPFIHATLVNGDHRLLDFSILVDSGGQTMGTASVATRAEWDALVTPANRVVDALGATGLSNDPEGTTHEAFVTQMDRLLIGPFEFEDPLVSYSAGGPSVAVMGASLLHRFSVVFDYSRKQLILEPNVNFDEPPMVDRSGAMLAMSTPEGGGFEVLFVANGTPAHEAGLSRGDVIQAVDGVPTDEIRLNEARAIFCRSGGYRLNVQRDGERFETVIETRSLFDD